MIAIDIHPDTTCEKFDIIAKARYYTTSIKRILCYGRGCASFFSFDIERFFLHGKEEVKSGKTTGSVDNP